MSVRQAIQIQILATTTRMQSRVNVREHSCEAAILGRRRSVVIINLKISIFKLDILHADGTLGEEEEYLSNSLSRINTVGRYKKNEAGVFEE